jgi:hypothetical protein
MATTSQNIATSRNRVLEALHPIARLLARQAAGEGPQGSGHLPTHAGCNEGHSSPSSPEQTR